MVVRKSWVPALGTYSVGSSNEPFNPALGDELLCPELEDFLNVASMANLAHVYLSEENEWHARGEPTEIAIEVFASRFDWNRGRWTKGSKPTWQQKAEFPFDSAVKKMSLLDSTPANGEEKNMLFSKGAVDTILRNMGELASLCLRILALAQRSFDPSTQVLEGMDYRRDEVEKNLQFLGLVGIYDPPRPETAGALKQGIFTWEVVIDILAYGLWTSALCLSSFSLAMWGFGDDNLGRGCNRQYSKECELVFRACATTFVCLTWFALFLTWEMVNMRRSFFRMQPKSKKYLTKWAYDVWRNQFLFWSIHAGFITVIPILYIPIINDVVFKHTGITWECLSPSHGTEASERHLPMRGWLASLRCKGITGPLQKQED
ncbi:hypothetical protein PENARI_c043G03156 [Penicillium arizonense]|uniref:Cation-transporting P-type ATPase C-terminal domain-containing protein n=1 Tax=Penicillium arizonense TaxID=1835702 RepID=A0A1F5L3F9_PENAI|nr:hypothetical protein PENARI_c043G03156 [Penicillium arizonense]OGE47461.1 hypothetical protein PENARI_c043G03156 [Penicillium arizonense]